jgi:hypothetical protein
MTSGTPASSPWGAFSQDPRRPEAATLRASDRDRDVVLGVLAEGYADGRITKEEYDERSGSTAAAKTLGELPALIVDLVPLTPTRPRNDLALASTEELHARAVQKWEAYRRDALRTVLVPSLICWTVWYFASFRHNADPGFPWPVIVTLVTALRLLQVLTNKSDIVAREQARLERKQRKALEAGPEQG